MSGEGELVRLSKRMSELGLCSRREADVWIERGWVSVNGEVVSTLGSKVRPQDQIAINQSARADQQDRVTVLLNKPVGIVSGQPEPPYRPAIELIRPEAHWVQDRARRRFERRHLSGLAPSGRLDIDSTGLLVLTQDGRIAKQLIGEHSAVDKEYLVRVQGKLNDSGLQRLRHGLSLDGKALKPATVLWQNDDQLKFVLTEGRNRQIRRMCELVGLEVVGLKRVRIGQVRLGELPLGQWRYLGSNERF